MDHHLTRRQQEIFEFLCQQASASARPPTLSELCDAMGLSSRGSMHKQVQALVDAGLVEPMNNQRRGIRLTDAALAEAASDNEPGTLPMFGYIAAGGPIEAISGSERVPSLNAFSVFTR